MEMLKRSVSCYLFCKLLNLTLVAFNCCAHATGVVAETNERPNNFHKNLRGLQNDDILVTSDNDSTVDHKDDSEAKPLHKNLRGEERNEDINDAVDNQIAGFKPPHKNLRGSTDDSYFTNNGFEKRSNSIYNVLKTNFGYFCLNIARNLSLLSHYPAYYIGEAYTYFARFSSPLKSIFHVAWSTEEEVSIPYDVFKVRNLIETPFVNETPKESVSPKAISNVTPKEGRCADWNPGYKLQLFGKQGSPKSLAMTLYDWKSDTGVCKADNKVPQHENSSSLSSRDLQVAWYYGGKSNRDSKSQALFTPAQSLHDASENLSKALVQCKDCFDGMSLEPQQGLAGNLIVPHTYETSAAADPSNTLPMITPEERYCADWNPGCKLQLFGKQGSPKSLAMTLYDWKSDTGVCKADNKVPQHENGLSEALWITRYAQKLSKAYKYDPSNVMFRISYDLNNATHKASNWLKPSLATDNFTRLLSKDGHEAKDYYMSKSPSWAIQGHASAGVHNAEIVHNHMLSPVNVICHVIATSSAAVMLYQYSKKLYNYAKSFRTTKLFQHEKLTNGKSRQLDQKTELLREEESDNDIKLMIDYGKLSYFV